ncbi:MAG: TlpA family protein disulfide reductase [Bacteroidales bacterium]|nr:TlpA family protein disulfide reductase [Bacteroidales bacterium]
MKKIALIAAAALMVLTGCKNQKSNEEILADFQAGVQAVMDDYRTAAEKVDADETLTDEQKDEQFEALEETAISKLVSAGRKVLAKNAANVEVAPKVISNIYSYMDDDELDAMLAPLSEEVKATEVVSYILGNLETKKATAVGKKFVDFTVDHVAGVDKDGNPIYEKKSLSDFVGKGKVMLVDFWSPWCPPCKAELPNIKAVWEKYHGDDFDVLSVAVWEESRKMNWRNTIDTAAVYGVNWLQLNNGHKEPADLYGIDGIPHMILFDKDGTILKRGDDLRGAKTDKAVAEALGR